MPATKPLVFVIFTIFLVLPLFAIYRLISTSSLQFMPTNGSNAKLPIRTYSGELVLEHLKFLGHNQTQHCKVKNLDFDKIISTNMLADSSSHFIMTPTVSRCNVQEETDGSSTSDLLFVLILSQFDHYFKRLIIRKTWASLQRYENVTFVYRFVIGIPYSTGEHNLGIDVDVEQAALTKEARAHDDIIQVNTTDKYELLTIKHLAALEYQQRHCPNVTWIVKADEDIFLNVVALARYISTGASGEDIICPWVESGTKPSTQPKPHRNGRWGLSEGEYPFREFPTFCHGQVYAYRAEVARRIQETSAAIPCHLWLEDVYVSGILANVTGAAYPSKAPPASGVDVRWKDIPTPGVKHAKTAVPTSEWVRDNRYLRAHVTGEDITKYRRQLLSLWRDVSHAYHIGVHHHNLTSADAAAAGAAGAR